MPWAIAPVDLSLDDERIDDAPGVLDAHVAKDRDRSRVGLDLHHRGLGARRERPPDRIVEPRGLEARLRVGRAGGGSRGGRPRATSSDRRPARRRPLHRDRPSAHLEIRRRRPRAGARRCAGSCRARARPRASPRRRRSPPGARRRRRGRTGSRRCRRAPRAPPRRARPARRPRAAPPSSRVPCPCDVTPASTVTAPDGSIRTVAPSWPVRNGMRGPAEAACPRPGQLVVQQVGNLRL